MTEKWVTGPCGALAGDALVGNLRAIAESPGRARQPAPVPPACHRIRVPRPESRAPWAGGSQFSGPLLNPHRVLRQLPRQGQAEGRRLGGAAVRPDDARWRRGRVGRLGWPLPTASRRGRCRPEDAEHLSEQSPADRSRGLEYRAALDRYDAQHAGEPGRVTVRRLTSAEYAYALRDLTGIDITVSIDASTTPSATIRQLRRRAVRAGARAYVLEAARQVPPIAPLRSVPAR